MYLFAHARTALWYGLQKLSLKKGQVILVPDYVCDVVLHPVEALEIRVVFYPVDDCFNPDWQRLELIQQSESAHALLMVHYFGQPQNIGMFSDFCRRYGMMLIEDNAHGYGGNLHNKPLGSYGHLGISSPRKQLHTNSGGILYLSGQEVECPQSEFEEYPLTASDENPLRLLLRSLPVLKLLFRRLFLTQPVYSDPSTFPEDHIDHFAADPDSVAAIMAEDWPHHASKRREAWKAWSAFVLQYGLQPVWKEPHPESCPWALPVYAKNRSERLRWLEWGWRNGLSVFPWPTLPESILQDDIVSNNRWHRLFCIGLDTLPDKKLVHNANTFFAEKHVH